MDTQKTCPFCGAEIAEGAKFCTVCGKSVADPDADAVTPESEASVPAANEASEDKKDGFGKKLSSIKDKVAKKISDSGITEKAKSNPNLLRDAAILLLAFIMLICSFAPIIRFDMELELGKIEDTVSFKISPFTSVGFMFDAMMNKSNKELNKSNLYDRYENKLEVLEDVDLKAKKLTVKERNAYGDILVIMVKMMLRSEDTRLTFSLLVSALVSLAYILLAVGLFAVAVINILSHFGGKKNLYLLAIKLLSAMPFVALITYFTVKLPLTALAQSNMEAKMGGSAAIMIISLIGIIALAAYNVFTGKIKFDLKALVYRAVILILTIATVCTVSAPALGATVKAEFGGKKKQELNVTLDANSLLELEMNKDEVEDIEKVLGKEKVHKESLAMKFSSFASYTKKQVEKGEMDQAVSNALLYSYVSGGAGLRFFISKAPYLMITASAMIAFVAWAMLNELLTGEKKSVKIATIVMVATFAASLLLALIYVWSVNGRLDELKLISTLKTRVGSAYLLFAIFGALTMFLPTLANKLGISTELAPNAIAAPATESAEPAVEAEYTDLTDASDETDATVTVE